MHRAERSASGSKQWGFEAFGGLNMRNLVVAGLGLLAVAAMPQRAGAADLPVKAPLAPVAVPFSWTGFYVGANVGYSVGRADTDLGETSVTSTTATITTLGGTPIATATVVSAPVVFAGSDRAKMNGWLAGVQAGYNWQFDRWVWGIEGDVQVAGERGGTSFCFPTGTPCGAATTAIGTANYSLPWLGTLRGRTGATFDRVLLYVTGGLAAGQVRADFNDGIAPGVLTPAGTATASGNVTRLGWVIGAGIEGAVTNNWSVKLEYLHVDLGSVSASATGSTMGSQSFTIGDFITTLSQTTTFNSAFRARVTDDIVRIGLNYRFGGPVVARY
jgi:outer membrane immunogenic protein